MFYTNKLLIARQTSSTEEVGYMKADRWLSFNNDATHDDSLVTDNGIVSLKYPAIMKDYFHFKVSWEKSLCCDHKQRDAMLEAITIIGLHLSDHFSTYTKCERC